MSTRVSSDGEVWYEATDEQFAAMVADESVDCWVDLSSDGSFLVMPISAMRNLAKTDWDAEPKTLYGLPVVFTEEV
jgi:hypothetical protein